MTHLDCPVLGHTPTLQYRYLKVNESKYFQISFYENTLK